MKINKFLAFTALTGSLIFSSCSSDDDFNEPEPQPEGGYSEGVIILNEGSQSQGTVSFLDEEFSSVENNIFESVNPGMGLGGYLQSIFFDGDLAYIISNGSNLITVVDRYTFEYVASVDSGLNIPYYGVAHNGKAYVSNLAGFDTGEDDYIAVIDLETLEVEQTLVAGTYLDKVLEEDGLIYVQGSSFGNGNSVHVFDPSSNSISYTFTTNQGLSSFEIEDDNLYALSGSQLQVFDINSHEEISTINFPEDITSPQNLDIEDDMIYFTASKSVYMMAEDATEFPEESLFDLDEVTTLYSFEVEDDIIWTGDARDYSSAGAVRLYSLSGELMNEFSVGINPNSFYFND
ncbi:YncE family protein [Autumnicola edwardsiae]|uniref:Quinoprotein amine dehydrogenase n=1 Tax=Autumnicola edwardsiae TaxID=3075594 RepID=A0ABU3CS39_9FLAO|nr:DUF5074 domain-containing protein [Zunongwangia sp. F297]MDT0649163.1 quinoprotein amine dehydrogenase [Zunongwangia sp. F297]